MQRFLKKHNLTLKSVYSLLGFSKQNISYWSLHPYSTQSKTSIYKLIEQAKHIFELSNAETEILANSAGLSLQYEGGYIIDILGYQGKLRTLCSKAMVSERMLRLYKKVTPTKNVILALCVVLDKNENEINEILHKYGYCLSNSIISDVVIKWYLKTNSGKVSGTHLIFSINETLEKMGVPLLMTKQSGR